MATGDEPIPGELRGESIHCDPFAAAALPASLRWHCEPRRWSLDPARRVLRIEPDAPTDFWQRTHYGFRVDNGHFLGLEVAGDFALTARVRFRPAHQYDQAGVMVRLSPDCWLKSSVEFEPHGPSRLGAVVTNFGYSDWSTQDFHPGRSTKTSDDADETSVAGQIWLRLRREADDYLVHASPDGNSWSQLRVAHLHQARGLPVACGLYACSPKRTGFSAEFDSFTVDRPATSV